MGSVSLGGMTSMAGNAIAAFVGPPLGVESGPSLRAVRVGYPGIQLQSWAEAVRSPSKPNAGGVGINLAFSGEEARRE
jgi:hypothetical protein